MDEAAILLLPLPIAPLIDRVNTGVLVPVFILGAAVSAWFGIYLMGVVGAAP